MFVEIVQFKMYAKSISWAALDYMRMNRIMVPEIFLPKITPYSLDFEIFIFELSLAFTLHPNPYEK